MQLQKNIFLVIANLSYTVTNTQRVAFKNNSQMKGAVFFNFNLSMAHGLRNTVAIVSDQKGSGFDKFKKFIHIVIHSENHERLGQLLVEYYRCVYVHYVSCDGGVRIFTILEIEAGRIIQNQLVGSLIKTNIHIIIIKKTRK